MHNLGVLRCLNKGIGDHPFKTNLCVDNNGERREIETFGWETKGTGSTEYVVSLRQCIFERIKSFI